MLYHIILISNYECDDSSTVKYGTQPGETNASDEQMIDAVTNAAKGRSFTNKYIPGDDGPDGPDRPDGLDEDDGDDDDDDAGNESETKKTYATKKEDDLWWKKLNQNYLVLMNRHKVMLKYIVYLSIIWVFLDGKILSLYIYIILFSRINCDYSDHIIYIIY